MRTKTDKIHQSVQKAALADVDSHTYYKNVNKKIFGDINYKVHQVAREERYELGRGLRKMCPRSAHAEWKVPSKRRDALDLMLESEKGRFEKLLPMRHGRMAISPFTFYRGSAFNMAYDLSHTPVTGLFVQACGDAHLSNFGGFATPERQVIFSINDLDETLPAPWEWDVKRLAASFVVASRNNGLSDKDARDTALRVTQSYREHMHEYMEMKTMDLWHYSMTAESLISGLKDKDLRKRAEKRVAREKHKSVAEEIFPQLAHTGDGKTFIKDVLPSIFHWEGQTPGTISEGVMDAYQLYRKSLHPIYSFLMERYRLTDAAFKVVGVGSVGTMCVVFLFMTADGTPLFLQGKEARASVLEPFAGKSIYSNHGQRIYTGYRLMQPFSDPFLGWTEGKVRHFFFRQLRDIKISIRVETFGKPEMMGYAEWCGQALALSHARSSDAAIMSGYMGKSDKFDQAIADFSVAYADQNEKDYAVIKQAIASGKIDAEFEE